MPAKSFILWQKCRMCEHWRQLYMRMFGRFCWKWVQLHEDKEWDCWQTWKSWKPCYFVICRFAIIEGLSEHSYVSDACLDKFDRNYQEPCGGEHWREHFYLDHQTKTYGFLYSSIVKGGKFCWLIISSTLSVVWCSGTMGVKDDLGTFSPNYPLARECVRKRMCSHGLVGHHVIKRGRKGRAHNKP